MEKKEAMAVRPIQKGIEGNGLESTRGVLRKSFQVALDVKEG